MPGTKRRENVMAVLDAVTGADCFTRSAISAETGLSTVTVGKAAESLLDCGVFATYTDQKKGVGRKVEKIKVAEDRLFVVLDLSGYDMVMTTYDIKCTPHETVRFHEIADFSYRDNLRMFLHRVKKHMLDNKKFKYLAICLIVPGRYNRKTDTVMDSHPGFNEIRLKDFIRQAVGIPIDMVIDSRRASMRYCLSKCLKTDNVLLLTVNRDIEVCVAVGGKEISAGRNSMSLFETDVLGQLADIIVAASCIMSLNAVFIQTEGLRTWPTKAQMEELIEGRLERNRLMPRVTISNNCGFSSDGGAIVLSRSYVRQLISSK